MLSKKLKIDFTCGGATNEKSSLGVSEQFLNGTSAHNRLFSAMKLL